MHCLSEDGYQSHCVWATAYWPYVGSGVVRIMPADSRPEVIKLSCVTDKCLLLAIYVYFLQYNSRNGLGKHLQK